MCSQLLNGACDTICKQIVKEELAKESGHHRLNIYNGRIHVVRRMIWLCCSKFTRTLDKSNRSSLSPSHRISFKIIEDLSQSPKLWTDICVRDLNGKIIKFSGQCACVHEKKTKQKLTHTHRCLIVLKVCIEKHFTRVEPNENDWPNHFHLKIDVVDMNRIQSIWVCVHESQIRRCSCLCLCLRVWLWCLLFHSSVCVKPSSLSFRSKNDALSNWLKSIIQIDKLKIHTRITYRKETEWTAMRGSAHIWLRKKRHSDHIERPPCCRKVECVS